MADLYVKGDVVELEADNQVYIGIVTRKGAGNCIFWAKWLDEADEKFFYSDLNKVRKIAHINED